MERVIDSDTNTNKIKVAFTAFSTNVTINKMERALKKSRSLFGVPGSSPFRTY